MIRVLQRSEKDDVFALEEEDQSTTWSRAQLESEFGQGLALGFFDGGLLGFVFFRAAVDAWTLMQLRVAQRARQQGIAKSLLRAGLSRMPDACDHALLEVRSGNEAARSLYEKMGFVAVGIRPRYYAGHEDAIVMRLPRPCPSDADACRGIV